MARPPSSASSCWEHGAGRHGQMPGPGHTGGLSGRAVAAQFMFPLVAQVSAPRSSPPVAKRMG